MESKLDKVKKPINKSTSSDSSDKNVESENKEEVVDKENNEEVVDNKKISKKNLNKRKGMNKEKEIKPKPKPVSRAKKEKNKINSPKANISDNKSDTLNIENDSNNEAYEDQYEARIFSNGNIEELNSRLSKIIIMVLVAIVITVFTASRNLNIKPSNAYIPVDDEYKIVYGITNRDTFEPEDIVNFTNEAIEETFSFNYLNYNKRFQHIYNTYYTRSGSQSLDRALNRRNFFKFLAEGSLKLSHSRVVENALIKRTGESSNNLPAWVLDIEVELRLLTSQERRETLKFEVIVEQMPVQQRRGQLGISSIQQVGN